MTDPVPGPASSRLNNGWVPQCREQSTARLKAVVPSGKPQGTHVGKVAIKARGQFTVAGIPDVPSRYCRLLQHADGYVYATGGIVGQAPGGVAVSAPSTSPERCCSGACCTR